MSDNTYGSSNLRFESISHISGKTIKDTLFCNIYDYWTNFMILISVAFGGTQKL